MFSALGRLANSHPRRVLGVTVLFFVIAGALGGPVAGLLNSDNDSFSDTGATSAQAIEQIEKAAGQDASPSLIALVAIDDKAAIAETTEILSDPAVKQVVGGPEMGQQFVSKDGKQTYFAAIYKSGVDADKTTEHLRDELGRVDGVRVGGFGPA